MRGTIFLLGVFLVSAGFLAGPAFAQEPQQSDPTPPVLPPDPESFDDLELIATATATLGNASLNRVTLEYMLTATIRNTAATLIDLPYYVTVENAPAGANVVNNDFNLDDGTPVFRIEEALAPGDTQAVPITIALANRVRLLFSVRVYRLKQEPAPNTPPPAPTVSIPQSPTNATQSNLTGNTLPNALVRITGGQNVINVNTDSNGDFAVTLNLTSNKLNRSFFSTVDNGLTRPANPVEIIQDSEPPNLFIDFPLNNETLVTNATTLTVGGRVGDRLSGFMGLNVTVNGLVANVAIGIGPNGTFERSGVPLNPGLNVITAIATDVVGNQRTRTINVTRQAPTGATIQVLSGNGQAGQVQSTLPQPLVARVLNPDLTPFANKLVTFSVVRSDGNLGLVPPVSDEAPQVLQVTTNAAGDAEVFLRLGSDAGCASNRVRATAADVQGEALFCANSTGAPPDRILVATGNNQVGEVNGSACEQLSAWVNDGCNGAPNVAVTYRVLSGGGKVNGVSQSTVLTGPTGHANADFFFGPTPGQQVVEANFVGNVNPPATFVLTALERNENQPTSFETFVRDNDSQPLGGAECTLIVDGVTHTTTSDVDGLCQFSGIGDGAADFFVDGLTATTRNGAAIPQGSFPSLHFEPVIVPNAINQLASDVKLPELNPANARVYDGTADVELTIEGVEGLSMTIQAGSMRRADGTEPTPADPAIVALNQVDSDDMPKPMPDGADPVLAWTLQPGGATFDPPVPITYPNTSGLAPGAAAFFLSFDHDTGQFEIVATGAVSMDGSVVVSDPGSGLTVAGWGCQCPPYSVPGDCENCAVEITTPTANPLCICPGTEVTFTATGMPPGGDYSWTGGTPVSGANTATYRANFPNTGEFTVSVYYECDDDNDASASCTVTVELPTNTINFRKSRHPDLASPKNAQTLFNSGAAIVRSDDDGPGDGGSEDDVCADLTFNITDATSPTFPDQSANTFPANERFDYRLAKYNNITNDTDTTNLLRATFANIKQIQSGNGYTGVAFLNSSKMILTESANDRTAIHEFGHMAGLEHRDSTNKNIMYSVFSTTKNEVNKTERDALAGYSGTVLGD